MFEDVFNLTNFRKCETNEIYRDGRQVPSLPNTKNSLVENVSNSRYGGSKMEKNANFTNRENFQSPNRAYNGSKNCFRGICPKTFVDGRKTFWRGQKTSPVKF